MRPALACLMIALAMPAMAGPWLREDGAGFLSFSAEITGGETTAMGYADWGLGTGTTIALSGFAKPGDGAADLSVIRALPLPSERSVASYSLVLKRASGASPGLMAGLGLSWGRSLPGGWLAVDTRALASPDGRAVEAKLDVTWGQALRPGLDAMVQLHASHDGDALSASLVPSAIVALREGVRLNLGITQGLTGQAETGVKMGLWLDF
ncbi:hypothetical protein [Mesobacterium pallidum]|uniref:hypothetical protein n=1 Tax=Mesobacterium pallidum TaxID=2872037 RepID=UPI001EE22351|nr:hypothetical protein [Mesobacterium pallidum]